VRPEILGPTEKDNEEKEQGGFHSVRAEFSCSIVRFNSAFLTAWNDSHASETQINNLM